MLYLDQKYAREMVAHALEDDPNECCGILAGKKKQMLRLYPIRWWPVSRWWPILRWGEEEQILKLYRITNVEASPYRYSIDPQELLKAYLEIDNKGWDIIAFYHSHTHSEAYPSATDVRLATWPEVRYLLISLLDRENPPIRAFHIENGNIIEEELKIGEA